MSSSRRTLSKLLGSAGAAGVLPSLGAASGGPTVADGFDADGAVEAALEPEAITLAPIEDRTVDAGDTVTIEVRTSPAEDVTLSAEDPPEGATFIDHGDGTGRFRWATHPADTADSPSTVTFQAANGETSDSQAVRVTVDPPERNPNRTAASDGPRIAGPHADGVR